MGEHASCIGCVAACGCVRCLISAAVVCLSWPCSLPSGCWEAALSSSLHLLRELNRLSATAVWWGLDHCVTFHSAEQRQNNTVSLCRFIETASNPFDCCELSLQELAAAAAAAEAHPGGRAQECLAAAAAAEEGLAEPEKQMQKRQKVATGLAAEGVPSCCLDEEQLSRLQAGALCRSRLETHHLIQPTNSRLCLRGLSATASFRRLLPVAYQRALLPGDWYTVRGTVTAGA